MYMHGIFLLDNGHARKSLVLKDIFYKFQDYQK